MVCVFLQKVSVMAQEGSAVQTLDLNETKRSVVKEWLPMGELMWSDD
jgi:hypothetical protein